MAPSSAGKFDLKNARGHQKPQKFKGLPIPEKLLGGFHWQICCFCGQGDYVVKISGNLDSLSES